MIDVLNESLEWNIKKLPNNTFELQFKKYCEEVDEAIEAEKISYQRFVEELADVFITIGGMMRFNPKLAEYMLKRFINDVDKPVFEDVIKYARCKIKILYTRDYSNGYHH